MSMLKYCPDCSGALVSQSKCACGWINKLSNKKIDYSNTAYDKYGNTWPICRNVNCNKIATISHDTRS